MIRIFLTPVWARPRYVNVMNIHMEAPVPLAAYLHDIPKPFFIAAMVFGFIWHWPLGLVILAYLIGSGRMGGRCGAGRWYPATESNPGTGQNTAPWSGFGWGPGGGFRGFGRGPSSAQPSSNRAFDEYRAETLRRLEEEQKEFMEYLERLRQARDKQEFDSFMADRRRNATPPDAPQA